MTHPGVRFEGVDIPQAANLGRVRRVAAAVVLGHRTTSAIVEATGISRRHVTYSLHAASTLGLLDTDGGPTDTARLLAATPESSEAERHLLRRCIEDSLVIGAIAPGLLSASPPSKDTIADRIQRATELGRATSEHRAGDLLAWRTQIFQTRIPVLSDGSASGATVVYPKAKGVDVELMNTHTVSIAERTRLFERNEGHFLDFKAKEIAPAKLSRTLSAFANADGGELWIGIAEVRRGVWSWEGFPNEEAANAHVQCFDSIFALGSGLTLEFVKSPGVHGLVLHATIQKTRDVKRSTDGIPYIRRGAQNEPVTSSEAIRNLERTKGVVSFEDETVGAAGLADIANSAHALKFMLEVIPNSEPEPWLRKQQLVLNDRPTVAGVVLFAEEPQVFLPKAAVKIYRYRTSGREGTREHLAFNPITIEGPLYDLIQQSVEQTVGFAQQIQKMTDDGLQPIQYPPESLHEIITNALLHRDYSLNDDVHVRIFDNRVEVESPGRLPAHITPANILRERFARNPKIVRLINKFPNPPNKDVGEGLNTAFSAMKKLRLRDPQISERDNSVLVALLHEKLASPEQQIVDFTREHGSISNAQARVATGIESEVKVRAILQKLVRGGELEQVPGTIRASTAYRLPPGKR